MTLSAPTGKVPGPRRRHPTEATSRSESREVQPERPVPETNGSPAQSRSRWRDPALLVALLALVVSVITAGLGQLNQNSNEVNQDRQRLTAVLDNIAKVRADYAADGVTPEIVVYVPSLNEADLLIKRLEGTRLATSPYEKIGVAQGFNQVNEPKAAIDLLSRAEAQSGTSERLADRTDSSRMLAISYYLAGRPEDGDRALQRSLDYVALAPPGYSEALKNGLDYTTYLVWVEQNLERDDCPAARAHLDLLKKTANRLPTLGRGTRADAIQAKESDLGKVCGN